MNFNELLSSMEQEINSRNNWNILTSEVVESVRKNCIFILWKSSQLLYFRDETLAYHDKCTTGKSGFWEGENSLKSPRWLHKVWWIVWTWWNINQWIKEKKITWETLPISRKWEILPGIISRVIILNWCEINFNFNSYQRSIYIHWSRQEWFWDDDETNLQRSLWCFWLRWKSVAELVDTHLSNINWELYVYVFEKY